MIISHKIRIYPNHEQEVFLKKSCGVARFAYNWGLAEWEKQYKSGEKPTYLKLKKQFNGIKQNEFPFVCEVSKCCAETAFLNLGKAYKNFFDKRAKFPRFKKKGIHDSFGLSNDAFSINATHIKLPKMQPMRMAEEPRFSGKIMSGTVSRVADKWFISISVEIKRDLTLPKTGKYVGVDLGVKDIAITSDGFKFANPRWIQKSEKKLKRLNRELARRQRTSKRRVKTRLRLARQHSRITNQRRDWLHKITTYLVRNYDVISLETLNVRGMVKNHNLAKESRMLHLAGSIAKLSTKHRCMGNKFIEWIDFFLQARLARSVVVFKIRCR